MAAQSETTPCAAATEVAPGVSAAEAEQQAADANEQKSKFAASIETKGENSYYFAHARPKEDLSQAKRITGDGSRQLADLDHGPAALETADDWLVESSKASAEIEKINWREDYAWGDDTGKVKVYVEFAEGSLKDPSVRITSKFEARNFEVVVFGLPGGPQGVRNGSHELQNEIVPGKCSYRVNSGKNKISITLAKLQESESWGSLKKKVISQHTGWN
eukprot:TRINITY_DN1848_c0_g1_i1.p1 TRINITY_DN1848_c0_g1~~TRINITY_DN1848_c0_g1_i1.p1  ORF type:complete len:240 (-),score=61.69 TRINITY_DN1848_c0_g1_i1:47-700(-)